MLKKQMRVNLFKIGTAFLFSFLTCYSTFSLEIGEPAPNILGHESQSKEVVRVINFWGTWCGPCKEFIPFYNELNQRSDVEVIGVALERGSAESERKKALEEYMNSNADIPGYSIILDQFDGGVIEEDFLVNGGWFGIPVSFVISPDGVLADIISPGLEDREEFIRNIDMILDKDWDFEETRGKFAPIREEGMHKRAVYNKSKEVRERLLSIQNENEAYEYLMGEINTMPDLKNYVFYLPLILAIKANKGDEAEIHFNEMSELIKDREHLLIYLIKEVGNAIGSDKSDKIMSIKLEIAQLLYALTQGQNQEAQQVLAQNNIGTVCKDGQCFAVPQIVVSQCKSILY